MNPSGAGERIAVLGDIHGNALALDAALATAERAGFDRLVLLGDLLTYGVDSDRVVERVATIADDPRVVLLRGNHDALYLPLGGYEPAPRFPWVAESIEYTRLHAPLDRLAQLPFVDALGHGTVFFAHANPFGPGDWRYLNKAEDHEEARVVLQEQGLSVGVFGHTHRACVYLNGKLLPAGSTTADGRGTVILNAGSVGQPRDRPRTTYVLLLDAAASAVQATFLPFTYDEREHVRRIMATSMTEETRVRLASFHLD